MFRELMAAWRGRAFLSEIVKDFEQMLVWAEEVFRDAYGVWLGEQVREEIKDSLYSTDRKINEAEQKIRRRLVEHLTVEPGVDIAACLVFMSIVKDAERIGDYAKNIFEVALLREKVFEEDEWTQALKEIQQGVMENFQKIYCTFVKAKLETAQEIMERHHNIAMRCEELIRAMAKKELPLSKGICYTLLSRYLKRVSAHLANIASAIVSPVDKIDFVSEGLL